MRACACVCARALCDGAGSSGPGGRGSTHGYIGAGSATCGAQNAMLEVKARSTDSSDSSSSSSCAAAAATQEHYTTASGRAR